MKDPLNDIYDYVWEKNVPHPPVVTSQQFVSDVISHFPCILES